MIDFNCPNCLTLMSVPESLEGWSERCPECRTICLVPLMHPATRTLHRVNPSVLSSTRRPCGQIARTAGVLLLIIALFAAGQALIQPGIAETEAMLSNIEVGSDGYAAFMKAAQAQALAYLILAICLACAGAVSLIWGAAINLRHQWPGVIWRITGLAALVLSLVAFIAGSAARNKAELRASEYSYNHWQIDRYGRQSDAAAAVDRQTTALQENRIRDQGRTADILWSVGGYIFLAVALCFQVIGLRKHWLYCRHQSSGTLSA